MSTSLAKKHLPTLRVNAVVSTWLTKETLTHIEGKRGGDSFFDSKTLTHIEGKCGGGMSRAMKTVTHDGVQNGSVDPPWLFQLYYIGHKYGVWWLKAPTNFPKQDYEKISKTS